MGGAGGIRRASSRISAPSAKSLLSSSCARLTRILIASPIAELRVARTRRVRSSAGCSILSRIRASNVSAIGAGKASAPTVAERSQISATPAVKTSPSEMAARNRCVRPSRPRHTAVAAQRGKQATSCTHHPANGCGDHEPACDARHQRDSEPRGAVETGGGQKALCCICNTGQSDTLSPRRLLHRSIARVLPQRNKWHSACCHHRTGQESRQYGKR